MIAAIQAWGPLAGIAAIFVGAITVWIKGIPARLLAKDAGDATLRGEEKGLREYLSGELSKCKEANDAVSAKLQEVENKNFQLTIVVSMLLAELLLKEPESHLVKRAKAVLELNIGFPIDPLAIEAAIERLKNVAIDPAKSDQLQAAEHAVSAAERTVVRAEKTVIEVKTAEKPEGADDE